MKARHTSIASSMVRNVPVPSRATTIVSGLSKGEAQNASLMNKGQWIMEKAINHILHCFLPLPIIFFLIFVSPAYMISEISFRSETALRLLIIDLTSSRS